MFSWAEIEPCVLELLESPLASEPLQPWMVQWSDLSALVNETMMRLDIGCTTNTADEERPRRKQRFMEEVSTPQQALDQQIKERLLASRLEPEGLRFRCVIYRAEAALYRKEIAHCWLR